jgi:transketolase
VSTLSTQSQLDQLCINTIRTLSIDAVQQANSGHPGTPMAMAPVVYCLWQRFLRFDPEHPIWPSRDRFVLSAGHASMLLYSLLHLCGVKAVNPKYEVLGELSVKLDDIKRFRQRGGSTGKGKEAQAESNRRDGQERHTCIPATRCRRRAGGVRTIIRISERLATFFP